MRIYVAAVKVTAPSICQAHSSSGFRRLSVEAKTLFDLVKSNSVHQLRCLCHVLNENCLFNAETYNKLPCDELVIDLNLMSAVTVYKKL